MGCAFSKRNQVKERCLHPSDPPKTRDCLEETQILSHKKVSIPHVEATKSSLQNQMSTHASSNKVVSVMDRILESRYDFDLIYITERIISVFFLPDLEEQRYRYNLKEVAAMLKLKHQERFLVINLSEKRHDICKLNPKVEEFGWPDLHAPSLDKICAVCKVMEGWLNSDPRNVVVLHCKGNKGKIGIIIAAYMHYSKISAGADQALANLAMRKFCEDKIASFLQPSQNRYIYYFAGLLSGAIKINSSPLRLHQVHIPTLPSYQPVGGFAPFLKIYQSLNLVYTSDIYDADSSRNKTLCIRIEPALQLKGDIMVKCYHRHTGVNNRECIFRVQFHTCTVHGAQLWFGKGELDQACKDDRYPTDATVQFVFTPGQEQDRGGEIPKKTSRASLELNCTDPVVRWDSYENFNLHYQDSAEDIRHTRGPLDGSLYAQVKKRRVPGSIPPVISPSPCRQIPFASSDSGPRFTPLEVLKEPPPPPPHYHTQKENNGKDGEREKTSVKEKDRETAILDDVDCSHLQMEHFCYSHPYSHPHSYCDPDLPSTHQQKARPKHHTLPCTRTSPLPVCEVCVSPPDVLWERGHCQHQIYPPPSRPIYPCPSSETHTHPLLTRNHSSHANSLPAQARLFCSGEACPLFYYSTQSPNSTHHSLPSSPYRELHFSSASPTTCSCRDCSHLREDLAHSLQVGQYERPPWSQESDFGYRREGSLRWTRDKGVIPQGPEQWPHRPMMPPPMSSFGHRYGDSVSKQDYPVCISDRRDPTSSPYPSPHSSGYHTPSMSCPCSPLQIRESPGYASMDHSTNSSPVALTPSPKRSSVTQNRLHNLGSSGGEHNLYITDTEGKTRNTNGDFSKETLSLHAPSNIGPEGGKPEPLHNDGHHEGSSESTKPNQEQQMSDTKDARECKSNTNLLTETIPKTELTPPSQRVEPVFQQDNVSTSNINHQEAENNRDLYQIPSQILNLTLNSPKPSNCPSERSSYSDIPLLGIQSEGQRLTSLTDGASSNEEGSSSDLRGPSPVPDGYVTPSFPLASPNYPQLTVPHVPYTGYTAITIPASLSQPPLPEKQHTLPDPLFDSTTANACTEFSSFSQVPMGDARRKPEPDCCVSAKFVQDSSKFWYKSGISRDQAIAVLKDKDPGNFLIRDSKSFHGAYGLALKVATPPPYANSSGHTSHSQEQLVRHFLIESGAKGVKIKGCQNEAYFGSLSALVYQHSITPVSLPCKLRIPDKDLVGELQELQSGSNTSTASELLKQGAACNVLFINSVDTESLTGPQAVAKAIKYTLAQKPLPTATVVHFKVSAQGITLTDNQRRLFFRRHYPIDSVIFSCAAPEDKRWIVADNTSKKMFGFVARRSGTGLGNVCHLFSEVDPEQPAIAIVNFINKVMLGPHHVRK